MPPAPFLTRQLMNVRKDNGCFLTDTPGWDLEPARAPIFPSRYRTISKSLWAINPNYKMYPEVSNNTASYADHGICEPVTRQFMPPRDDFVLYREEMVKPGNKLVMRKGGGSMKKTVGA